MSPEQPRPDPAARPAPYRPPRLVRYGSIVDLTASQQAGMGVLDGGVVAVMGKLNFLKSA
ncbi:MAG: lasso RiPP family leader peptide-containing protein [Myxococcota bacterium]|nr:lasso RiPP family leader peptide-containing protein [Myxococcota bacterium]